VLALALTPAVLTSCGGDDGGPAATAFERFDGGTGRLEDYEGTPLVLNFWASWCPPCVRELPALQEVAAELEGEVAFLGMNVTDDRAEAEALAAEAGVTYDLGVDEEGALFTALAGLNMPTTLFIDAAGDVVDTHEGAFDADELRTAIAEAFPADAS
jgi:cytochrome c biogenesis protein CcmG/thiol:disulfide interchange protein DsbE